MLYTASTSIGAVRAVIETQVRTVWLASPISGSDSQIAWQNINFKPPRNGYWLEVGLSWGESTDAIFYGAGSGVNFKLGILFLTVNGPKTEGMDPLYDRIEPFIGHFTRKSYSGIDFRITDGPTDVSTCLLYTSDAADD